MAEVKFNAFNIGDKIFHPSIRQKEIEVTCPDCHDEKKWIVSTPSGITKEIDCPRCAGGNYKWLLPKRFERIAEIKELEIAEVSICHGKRNGSDDITTHIRYRTAPWIGEVHPDRAYRTREDAEAAAETLMAEAAAREQSSWERELERHAKLAGADIVSALEARANEQFDDLKCKVDALREKMLDAVRYPTLYGPKITTYPYSAPEISSQALADWLSEFLEGAQLESWTENELHEATCHC